MPMRRSSLLLAAVAAALSIAVLATVAYAQPTPSGQVPATSRTFAFTYQVHVPPTKDASGKLYLWLPLPQQDDYQKIENLQIESVVAHTDGRDPQYHNPFVVFEPNAAQVEAGFDATVRFVATRREHKVDLVPASAKAGTASVPSKAELERYLEPDKMVPLNGVISELAAQQTAGLTDPLAEAHHIYDYVVATMRYDKSGEGWGRGDAVWACSSKRGNCTDFHSLLIGMMRSSGIPARFEIGFPLPDGKTEGDIPGYHCWAEFYLNGTGWVPVDASEAWKHPAQRDYFFGAHDVNRVFFSYGRDLRLSPEQKGDPLNYFIYPYAELNGKPMTGLQTHFSFKDVASNTTAANLPQ